MLVLLPRQALALPMVPRSYGKSTPLKRLSLARGTYRAILIAVKRRTPLPRRDRQMKIEMKQAVKLYRAGNNGGAGYGSPEQTVDASAEATGRIVLPRVTS